MSATAMSEAMKRAGIDPTRAKLRDAAVAALRKHRNEPAKAWPALRKALDPAMREALGIVYLESVAAELAAATEAPATVRMSPSPAVPAPAAERKPNEQLSSTVAVPSASAATTTSAPAPENLASAGHVSSDTHASRVGAGRGLSITRGPGFNAANRAAIHNNQAPSPEGMRARREAGHSSVATVYDRYKLPDGRRIGDVRTNEYLALANSNLRYASLFRRLHHYAKARNKTGPGVLTRELMGVKELEKEITASGVIDLDGPASDRGIIIEPDGRLSYFMRGEAFQTKEEPQ